mmetsp:Transcript_98823/g.279296  ORF Transcript_98823/g.279296 Transcript_98823/m.279296 type:complete len:210 (-) Transcript_98823:77-706(-)|eukprot:CAMPEP_0117499278 /NCGR_PEP_ID=MMETSP0784-20121206/22163_1 /TAXON_ID=39447 /ORGANISM="" /LENGTH=209 /DNA_ID=CAMNT_0005294421 /DNA_START=136 /DNA_END=762 /DNA_ORIENTATION=+
MARMESIVFVLTVQLLVLLAHVSEVASSRNAGDPWSSQEVAPPTSLKERAKDALVSAHDVATGASVADVQLRPLLYGIGSFRSIATMAFVLGAMGYNIYAVVQELRRRMKLMDKVEEDLTARRESLVPTSPRAFVAAEGLAAAAAPRPRWVPAATALCPPNVAASRRATRVAPVAIQPEVGRRSLSAEPRKPSSVHDRARKRIFSAEWL